MLIEEQREMSNKERVWMLRRKTGMFLQQQPARRILREIKRGRMYANSTLHLFQGCQTPRTTCPDLRLWLRKVPPI
jgi:hypothetical protein